MLSGPDRYFKTAPKRSMVENFARTFLQVATIWTMFLVLLPWGILWLQSLVGIPNLDSGAWRTVAVVVFSVAGFTGLTCAWSFVHWGGGTPIPCDQATCFTIVGPYRYVRNPMALLGILQGLMVALFLGSWPVAVYALLGAAFWEVVARPPEERDLLRRFGQDYEQYRAAVKCWVPRLTPYPRVVIDPNEHGQ
ncbi:MAG: isoprenylcysteine carboxylmethyltransferase family protein [Fimbriimonadaceae bacterium]